MVRSLTVACLAGVLLLASQVPVRGAEPETPSGDLTVLPFAYYTPETETAFVLLGIYTKPGLSPRPRPSSYLAFLTYTTQKQFMIHFFPDVYTASGFRISGGMGFMDYPDKFYGIGPDVTEADEEVYTKVDYTLEAAVQYEVVSCLFAGLQVDWENFTLEEVEPGGFFDSGTILGSEGGVLSGAGLLITYDSRDDIFLPGKGLYAEVAAMSHGEGTGSDFTYDNITLDLRQFVTLGSVTLGFQQYLQLSSGEPPFHRLAQLGGSGLMRGYFRGQYRDRNMVAVQVESRVPLSDRWGLVFFGSAGSVAPTPGDLDVDSFLTAAGTGLRFRVAAQEAINLRVDLAWGEDGNSGVYFTIKEAF